MSHKQMKEELTCPICMELFRQPRRLPCGHSYCHVCIKAMLDRRAEESGSYLNYSRPLVCPECREEVNVDFVNGIEGIPLDFKLSKLVDLFQFMKGQDDSDSSDESPAYKSVPCPVTSQTSGIETGASATGPSSFPVTSGPTTPLQPPADSPLVVPASTAQAVSESSPQPTSDTDTQARLTSSVTNPQWQSTSSITTSASTSLPSVTDNQLTSNTVGIRPGTRSEQPVSQSVDLPGSSPRANNQNPSQIDSVITFNLLQPAAAPLAQSQDVQTLNLEPQANRLSSGGTSQNAGRPVLSSPLSVESQISESDLGAVGGVELSIGVELSSAQEGESPAISQSAWQYSPLHIPSGEILREHQSARPVGSDRGVLNESSGQLDLHQRKKQLSNSVVSHSANNRELRSNSGRDRHLSQSSVSLPAEVTGDSQSCHEASPEINHISSQSDRLARAQSVPADPKNNNSSTHPRVVNPQSPQRQKTKTRKARRLNPFADTSSSNSDSDNEHEKREVKKSPGKKKRWLMTRFLRSMIFSDSSSTECSEESDTEQKKTAGSSRNTAVKAVSQQDLQTSSCNKQLNPAVSSHRAANLEQNQSAVVASVSCPQGFTDCRGQKNVPLVSESSPNLSSGQVHNDINSATPIPKRPVSLTDVGARYSSIDSNTQPKELARRGLPEQRPLDSQTLPKEIPTPVVLFSREAGGEVSHTQSVLTLDASVGPSDVQCVIPKTVSEPDVRERSRGRVSAPAHILSGPLPTLYDNLHSDAVSSIDRSLFTRYDNVVDTPTPHHTTSGRQRLGNRLTLIRDPEFNPCNQEHNVPASSHRMNPARTLYDNIDDRELVTEEGVPISPTIPRRPVRARDPVTDIEDLKTGFEHVHNESSALSSTPQRTNRRASPTEHMAELNLDAPRSLDLQTSVSDYCLGGDQGPYYGQQPDVDAGHPSSYENLTSPVTPSVTQGLSSLSLEIMVDDSTEGDLGDENSDHAVDPHRRQDANAEGTAQDANLLNVPFQQGVCGTSEEDLEFINNYFEGNRERFHRGSLSLQNLAPPGVAIDSDEANGHTVEDDNGDVTTPITTTATAAVTASSSSPTVSSVSSKRDPDAEKSTASSKHLAHSSGNGQVDNDDDDNDDDDEDDEEDDGSHSGTSMLQNKKKPRSRLRKFLTSLLSLSSSSDDDEENYDNRTSSSKSSDW